MKKEEGVGVSFVDGVGTCSEVSRPLKPRVVQLAASRRRRRGSHVRECDFPAGRQQNPLEQAFCPLPKSRILYDTASELHADAVGRISSTFSVHTYC